MLSPSLPFQTHIHTQHTHTPIQGFLFLFLILTLTFILPKKSNAKRSNSQNPFPQRHRFLSPSLSLCSAFGGPSGRLRALCYRSSSRYDLSSTLIGFVMQFLLIVSIIIIFFLLNCCCSSQGDL